jgi:carboxyl-terminal processing protease
MKDISYYETNPIPYPKCPSKPVFDRPTVETVRAYDEYENDIYARIENGELEDASKQKIYDSTEYRTKIKNRIVYGGGGIYPDVFVPIDTTENLEYFYQLRSLIPEFVYADYTIHPSRLDGYENMYEYKQKYILPSEVMTRFREYAAKGELNDEAKFNFFYAKISLLIKAYFAKQKWQSDAFFLIANDDDKVMKAALKAIEGDKK